MPFGCKQLPHKDIQPCIFLDFAVISHKDTMLETLPYIPSWNSINFDRWTISVGQVVPEIPPPYSLSDFSPDLHWSQGWPKIRGKTRNSADPRRISLPVTSMRSTVCFRSSSPQCLANWLLHQKLPDIKVNPRSWQYLSYLAPTFSESTLFFFAEHIGINYPVNQFWQMFLSLSTSK